MNIRHPAAALSVAIALALAPPAFADDDDDDDDGGGKPKGPCPSGYILTFDPANISGADQNDNDMVCVRTLPSGEDVFTDDRV